MYFWANGRSARGVFRTGRFASGRFFASRVPPPKVFVYTSARVRHRVQTYVQALTGTFVLALTFAKGDVEVGTRKTKANRCVT